MAAARE